MATRSKTGSQTKVKKPARRPRARKAPKKAKRKPSTKAKAGATAASRARAKLASPKPRPGHSALAPKPLPGNRRRPRSRPVLSPPRPVPAARVKVLGANPYDIDLGRNPANFQALTPLSFLQRAALAHPETIAIIHGRRRTSYAEFYARSRRLASVLAREGVVRGDTVCVLLANTPAMLEAHHGVPMTGGVLNALNTRLDPASIGFMLDH